MQLRPEALRILQLPTLAPKLEAVAALWAAHLAGTLKIDTAWQGPAPEQLPELPGRPNLPKLIDPGLVPHRSPYTPQGLAALVHAICHIEFNAIHLGLDAIWQFADMPPSFYTDWLRVAHEECLHFEMLAEQLQKLGYQYGDFDAHDGLWEMCEKTRHDITARMALVPRTLEARGLDATPLIQARLRKVGTPQALAVCDSLDIILRDEIGHVDIGNRWYRWLCEQQGLEPVAHYKHLARHYKAPRLRPPFNTPARVAAGFSEEELAYLAGDGVNEQAHPSLGQ
jgi:uncharacterized ferritin-like protein (DUF455 family)